MRALLDQMVAFQNKAKNKNDQKLKRKHKKV